MPTFAPTTPRIERKFADHPIAVPAPFTAGAEVTADVRAWIDGQLATVVGNAFGGALRRATDALTAKRKDEASKGTYHGPTTERTDPTTGKITRHVAPVTYDDISEGRTPQAWFDEIFTDYSVAPSNRGLNGPTTKSDPISSLARTFAETDLIAKLENKGHKVSVFRTTKEPDGRTSFTRLLDQQFERGKDAYLDRAKAAFAEAADLATEEEDEMDFSIPEDAVRITRGPSA